MSSPTNPPKNKRLGAVVLEIRSDRGNDSSSNHQFSGAFAVSFRDGKKTLTSWGILGFGIYKMSETSQYGLRSAPFCEYFPMWLVVELKDMIWLQIRKNGAQ